MDATASSSSSAALPSKKYAVFISFRGEDTRKNFTSHLYEALHQKNIETYIDYRLPKGDEISQALIQAIHDSSVSLLVFSKNYASSKWCLDELIHILQCKNDEGQKVIPIFYEVDPSDVRRQNGSYKEAFAKHERDFMHNQDKVKMWRDALSQAANLAGWDSSICRDESELIQKIVNDVLQKLDLVYPSALKNIVGIYENCKCIESLLEKIAIIGIWGMGGVGKTTMAEVVYTKLCRHYESHCFLRNVREDFEKRGLNYIRDKIVKGLFKEDLEFIYVKTRLRKKRVLIVIDDVSNSKQLDDLEIEQDCLGPGSRVIITSRDKQVLTGRVNIIYEAKALSHHESLRLFSLKAFKKGYPEIEFEQLTERIVLYAKGIPLALTILGSLLHSKPKEDWNSTLTKLKKIPNDHVQKVLKLSYDELDREEKEMFLDIACFLKGKNKEDVIKLLESFDYEARIGISRLVDKALITVDCYRAIQMHDLIQEMGQEIVFQECIEEPGRRSRLWNHEDVYDVFKNNKDTAAVQAITLNASQIKNIDLSADTFKKMPYLRFLKVHSSSYGKSSNVYLPFGLESFSDRLRYFQWDRYPSESLSSTFCAENLVEFRMEYSPVKKLWDGVQDLVNLKTVRLRGSKQLVELPDFSKARNLERLVLDSCENLCNVHPSILSLPKLHLLLLEDCSSLKSLHSERGLESLSHIALLGCNSLQELSLPSEKIRELQLVSTRIEILNLSIGCLNNLTYLSLNDSTLKIFPINKLVSLTSLEYLGVFSYKAVIEKPILHNLFNALRSLRDLCLEGCSNLVELPDNISTLSSLKSLSLCGSNIESLPSSIKHLSKLEWISLDECRRLRSLPQLPQFLKKLHAANCTSLETAFILSTNHRMEQVSLINCLKMDEHSLWGIMVDVCFSLMQQVYINAPRLEYYYLHGNPRFFYPGSRVPEWFRHNRTTEASLTIELAKPLDNLIDFIFCLVLPEFCSTGNDKNMLFFEVFLEDGGRVRPLFVTFFDFSRSDNVLLNSDHVFLWYDETICRDKLHEVKRKQNEQGTAYNPKLSFKCEFGDYFIKEYGVYPVYALEDHNLVEEVNLHFKKKKLTKGERHLSINEEEQLPPKKKILKAAMEDIMDQKRKQLDQKIEELVLRTIGIEDGDYTTILMRNKTCWNNFVRPKNPMDSPETNFL